ncbi:fungal-specific transcription factor domain-containing protein [Melampsora americana]|nr:fungal-specific transcription factor domain-containing protein [Melampsora americana]
MNLSSDQNPHLHSLSIDSHHHHPHHHHQLFSSSSSSKPAKPTSKDSSLDSNPKPTTKRSKTTRACDPCRGKKIRCELPELDRNNQSNQVTIVCVHCRLHQINCTWFLPITETRFKRKRKNPSFNLSNSSYDLNPQPSHHLQLDHSNLNSPIPPQPPVRPTYSYPYTPSQSQSQIKSNLRASQCKEPISTSNETTGGNDPSTSNALPTATASEDNRIYGSTSMSHIMHSTTSFPADRISQFDEQFSQAFEAGEAGEGYIRVIGTEEEEENNHEKDQTSNLKQDELKTSFASLLSPLTTKSLIQSYFSLSARIFPVLNQDEFSKQTSSIGRVSNMNDGSALLYSVCCVGAMSHRVDPVIRKKLRKAIYQLYRADDLLQSSDINTVIVLLLAGYTVEFEGAKISKKAWNAIGSAVRIAQSLGMHRIDTSNNSPQAYRRLRRQIWACCIIADRWVSVMFAGLTNVTDEQVNSLLNELNLWYNRLPDSTTTPAMAWTAGHLRVYAVPVRFLIHRPFTQSFNGTPRRLRFAVGPLELEQMRTETAECIRWVELHPVFLEAWAIGAYSFFVCCLIQYQAHVKFFSPSALEVLGRARAIYEAIQAPECYIRLRTCEVIKALHRAATLIGSQSNWSFRSRDLYTNHVGQSTRWADLLNIDTLVGVFGNNHDMMNDINCLNVRHEHMKAIEEEDQSKEIERNGNGFIENPMEQFWFGMGLSK